MIDKQSCAAGLRQIIQVTGMKRFLVELTLGERVRELLNPKLFCGDPLLADPPKRHRWETDMEMHDRALEATRMKWQGFK